jgi:hypothetical protein
MLYAMALLHLLCMGLLKESPTVHAASQYASQTIPGVNSTDGS